MRFGVSWSVKGIRPEARETAKEAARRAGMSLDDWLSSVILQQAAQAGVAGQPQGRTQAAWDSHGEDLSAVHQRLDDLSRRIDNFTRSGPAAYAPRRERADGEQTAELIGRLDRRIDQIIGQPRMQAPPLAPATEQRLPTTPPGRSNLPQSPAALDRALGEIAARQRVLNGQASPTRTLAAAPQFMAQAELPLQAPPLVPAHPPMSLRAAPPVQDLSGLEQQLRKITDQIETLRKPGVEEAINALRGELSDIGRALNDALPKRAIDAIEQQIAALTERIAEGRQSGVDTGALAGIEHGLTEVRDALTGLTPAENLVGFNEAVAGLAQKIDLIVAQRDPATMQQLQSAITTLRSMASNVASDEAVGRLAANVQDLAAKVEQIGRGPVLDVLDNLERRIDALSRAVFERAQAGNAVPPQLEALVHSLSDKIEQIQQSREDNVAVSHLEDRIVALVERLDASDSRLGNLGAIERGLADLLVHIEEMKASKQSEARPADSPVVDALKQDIARTQDALDAVHGTLSQVVDRLATIEKGIRAERRPAPAVGSEPLELTQPVGKLGVRLVNEPPVPIPSPAPSMLAPTPVAPASAPPRLPPSPAPQRPPMASRLPINPELPPDQPLEPGSGPPQLHAGARIAASEAALGGVRPAGAAPSGPSNFIAAARRAARAAAQEHEAAPPSSAEPAGDEARGGLSLRAKMMRRVKSLLVAASIVALVVGAAQFAGSYFNLSDLTKIAQRISAKPAKAPHGPRLAAVPVKPSPAAPAPATIAKAPLPAPQTAVQGLPSLFSPSTLIAPGDVTGSIPQHVPTQLAPTAPPVAAPIHDAGLLPEKIGGAHLRNAALKGDANAAYEVALRFAEGRGVAVNLTEAARWYDRAAAKGLAPAQFRYASMLEKGQGVKKDLVQAKRLYLAAAAQGNAKAMHNLAVLYAEGIDGRPDYATAVTWFRKAAQHGIADSQYNLGILYARGIGTAKNMAESYKWFALAAIRGDKESAKKRDEIAAGLDAKELAAARHAVESFTAEPQPEIATIVPVPPGGWDKAAAAPASAHSRAKPPMALGAFTVGNR